MKFKIGDEVKILNKSVRVASNWMVGQTGWIVDHRYNGRDLEYDDDFYYALSQIENNSSIIFHFLEHDLELMDKNRIIEFEWEDFKI